jgi:hypothetical protein
MGKIAGRSVTTVANGEQSWSDWLKERLRRRDWKPADLSRASGQKENGRPVIAPDVISGWLNSDAKPRPQFWQLLAEILEVEVGDIALIVSGVRPPERKLTARPPVTAREALMADPALSAAGRAMLLAAYDAATSDDQGAEMLRRAGLGERTVRARAKERSNGASRPPEQDRRRGTGT